MKSNVGASDVTESQRRAGAFRSGLENAALQSLPTVRQIRRILIAADEDARDVGYLAQGFMDELHSAISTVIGFENDLIELVKAIAPTGPESVE